MDTLYVWYANYGDNEPYFQRIGPDEFAYYASAQIIVEGLYNANICSSSEDPSDPSIMTVAITEFPQLQDWQVERIEQQVINWLMDNGHMVKR